MRGFGGLQVVRKEISYLCKLPGNTESMFLATISNSATPPLPPPPQLAAPPPSLPNPTIRRRLLLTSLAFSLPASSSLNLSPISADARGLFQMPPPRLVNRSNLSIPAIDCRPNYLPCLISRLLVFTALNRRYFLVRAGESEYETAGVINTNPVAKTSVDSGLSLIGKRQTVRAALALREMEACQGSCWIWPSITQRAYQAAEIIASLNKMDRSHIVPEYSFLDARGLGAYEGKTLESISEIYALDSVSPNTKPPPIDDGTPNESVSDVFVRVTQLMSILETQYSGDTVIIVSPDSDNLSVLQAGLIGLDLRRHGELSFGPGEVRFVDASSVPKVKQPASAVYKCFNPPSCR